MAEKKTVEVLIAGKVYTLSGYESEDYFHKVAAYINNKLLEFQQSESYKHQPPDMKSTLLALNIADDYFKAKESAEGTEEEMNGKEKELYDLKHDVISLKLRIEEKKQKIEQLKEALVKEEQKNIKLETELENKEKLDARLSAERYLAQEHMDNQENQRIQKIKYEQKESVKKKTALRPPDLSNREKTQRAKDEIQKVIVSADETKEQAADTAAEEQKKQETADEKQNLSQINSVLKSTPAGNEKKKKETISQSEEEKRRKERQKREQEIDENASIFRVPDETAR